MFSGKFNLGYPYVDLLESGTIHLLDLMRFLMGDVARVNAVGVNRYNKNSRHYPIDNVAVTVEFVSGAIGSLISSGSALSFKPWERVEVYGDRAWLSIEDQHELIVYDSETGPAQSWKPVIPNTLLFDEEYGGYVGLLENFAQAIRGVEQPIVIGWDGYRALELLRAIQLSIIHHTSIDLPLDPPVAEAEVAVWFASQHWPGMVR
jgi:predicted dehydrogenase